MSTARLFEREAELARIEDAIGAAQRGSGRLVFFEGEAGIGKTSLLEAGAAMAAERDFEAPPSPRRRA